MELASWAIWLLLTVELQPLIPLIYARQLRWRLGSWQEFLILMNICDFIEGLNMDIIIMGQKLKHTKSELMIKSLCLYMPKIISKFWWNYLRQITYFHGSEGREYCQVSLDDSESVWELCCTDSLGLCWGQHGRLFSPTLNALNGLIYF